MTQPGRIVAVSISAQKGVRKQNVAVARLVADAGIEGDAHAEGGPRQISLLAVESIETMRQAGADVGPGDFGENITTEGIVLTNLVVGERVRIGETELEITQHGKTCHDRCAIFAQVGDCVMPREGVFARVLHGGEIRPGDTIEVVP